MMRACVLAAALASALAGGASAASIVLPVAEVGMRARSPARNVPGRVVTIERVDVVPQVAGEIVEVCFSNGSFVKEGDALYRIDPVKYEAALKNAEARQAEEAANVSYAELSYERHKKLLETRAVSLDAVDNALSQRDSSRAALAAAKAALVVARDDLKHCTITAPISGKVGTTAKTKGNYVSVASDPLVTIVRTTPIRVRFSVSNRDFLELFGGIGRRFREEGRVSLFLANGEPFAEAGKVEYVDNEADELTDTILAYAVFENRDGMLRPGGAVSVSLQSSKSVDYVAVPSSSVLQDTQGPYVWVVGEGGAVERRSIARGDAEDGWVFVEKGLRKGERIVADGAHRVRRGMTVEPAR